MIGQVVNYRYEVLEKCGDGNFFSVYKARDKVLNRLVAVKVLVPHYSQNREFAERLISEAQNVTELNHPNIARVIEADSQDGQYFVAVEYVRGINLKDRIRRTAPFAISYAVDIALAVAEALDHAHQQGIVHGDVRPHNILTSPEGQVKLTDFGTMRALAAYPSIREATMLRSVHYTAPEVLRGESPQPASDIYSLGIILYEMLTGSVPYDGTTSTIIAARQLQDPVPSPQARNAGIPALLNEIVMKAMHKDPTQRFTNAAAFIAALVRVKEWLRTGQTPGWTVPEKGRKEDIVYALEEKPESFFKNLAFILISTLTIAVIAGIVVVRFFPSQQGYPVPNIVGQTLEQAAKTLGQTGLEIKDPKYEFNDQYPSGQIFMTDPKSGGMVPKDSPFVHVWISKGPEMTSVPSLVGMNSSDAARKLADAGFVLGRTTQEHSDNVPPEHIIRQSPSAGQMLEPQKPVDIVVSIGPKQQTTTDQPITEVTPPSDNTNGGTSTDTGQTPEDKPQAHDFTVRVPVPEDAKGSQEVRIVTIDTYGETEQYDEMHQPGDLVVKSIRAFGDSIEVKVFIGDNLVQDKVFE